MDAMSVGYPPEDKGKISVTASKGEWQEVIDWLISYMEPRDNAPAELVYWLINQGVYE